MTNPDQFLLSLLTKARPFENILKEKKKPREGTNMTQYCQIGSINEKLEYLIKRGSHISLSWIMNINFVSFLKITGFFRSNTQLH